MTCKTCKWWSPNRKNVWGDMMPLCGCPKLMPNEYTYLIVEEPLEGCESWEER